MSRRKGKAGDAVTVVELKDAVLHALRPFATYLGAREQRGTRRRPSSGPRGWCGASHAKPASLWHLELFQFSNQRFSALS